MICLDVKHHLKNVVTVVNGFVIGKDIKNFQKIIFFVDKLLLMVVKMLAADQHMHLKVTVNEKLI